MKITKSDVEKYLSDIFVAVSTGRFQISSRQKNQDIFKEYVFTEDDAKKVILSLNTNDFSDVVRNEHPTHAEEILYVFGKDIKLLSRFGTKEENVSLYIKLNKLANQYLVVISFHKQEHSLVYKFK